MATQNYQLTTYGKFTNAEACAVFDDLDELGESREFIELLITIIVEQNKGIRDFGRESAKELILMAVAKGFFIPRAMTLKERG